METSTQAQIDGWMPGQSGGDAVPVELDLDIRSAVPPWEAGTLLEEAGRVLATQEEGDLMGGPRFEQLFRATGTLRVGDEERELNGGGLRIRRTGIRRLATFWGHAWQSALFPSGRAFGCNVYPPRADGKTTFNEGYLFDGDGGLIPARVVQAPWLGELRAKGQDVTVVLESERGTTTIHGETLLSTFMVMPPEVGGGLHLQQAIARYTWDDESAIGMIERSMPLTKFAASARDDALQDELVGERSGDELGSGLAGRHRRHLQQAPSGPQGLRAGGVGRGALEVGVTAGAVVERPADDAPVQVRVLQPEEQHLLAMGVGIHARSARSSWRVRYQSTSKSSSPVR